LEPVFGDGKGVDPGHVGNRWLIGKKNPLKSRYEALKAQKVHRGIYTGLEAFRWANKWGQRRSKVGGKGIEIPVNAARIAGLKAVTNSYSLNHRVRAATERANLLTASAYCT
jgi:hypothetical protein